MKYKTALVYMLIIFFVGLMFSNIQCTAIDEESLIVSIQYPTSGAVGESLQFYGSASGGTSPYTWSWYFDEGGFVHQQNATHTYHTAGYYTVLLLVSDKNYVSGSSEQVRIQIKNIRANTNGPYTADIDERIIFNGSVIGGNPPYSWQWEFGDGTKSSEQNPAHAYNNEGRYSLNLTVNDSSGNIDSESTNVSTRPMTTWVDDDYESSKESWDYKYFNSIQKAINGVGKNGVVNVFNGIYYENLVINKSISLIGENRETAIIDGKNSGDVVLITADYVNLSDFTLQNSGSFNLAGIYITSNNSNITECIIKNNYCGIYLKNPNYYDVKENFISNNKIDDNYYGIDIGHDSQNNNILNNLISNGISGITLNFNSYDNTIKNNQISSCSKGIVVYDSYNNIITDNSFKDNTIGIHLVELCEKNRYNTISNNHFSGNLQDIRDNKNILLNPFFTYVVIPIIALIIFSVVGLIWKRQKQQL